VVMPNIEETDQSSRITITKDLEYKYPNDLDLHPRSEFHNKLKTKILDRARQSNAAITSRADSWNDIDRVMTTYIEQDDDEVDIKNEDERKPTSIVFPYSYAIVETILSYLVAAFFQEPIFRYEGVSPEDELGAIKLEKVVDLHVNRLKVALNLHTMFRDSFSYGFGAVVPTWTVKKGRKTVLKERGFWSNLRRGFVREAWDREVLNDVTLFEGNSLINIDPYLCLPDPGVSIHDVQDGEYFGWGDRDNLTNLLEMEKYGDGEYFNVAYLRDVHNKQSSIFTIDQSDRDTRSGGSWRSLHTNASGINHPTDVLYMIVNLMPDEWGLGKGYYPEKWKFALAADDVIIQAMPLDLDHDMFPVAIAAPDFDGYSSTPVSRLEILNGLQGTLDWLFNTHIANVRKAINDMLVIDPYLININDVKNPKPGKIIRTRRPAWGRGVEDAIKQLQVVDITQGHIADANFVVNFMQKIGGADDAGMGSLRQGGPERLTASEFVGTQSQAFSRMERVAKIIGLQAMQDIGYMFAKHTQQLMEEDVYVKAIGRWGPTLDELYPDAVEKGRMKVTPYDLAIDYDSKVRDGSVPGGNFNEIWVKLFELMATVPALQQKFDIVRTFEYLAKMTGAKNVDEFRIKAMPDQQVLDQADAGNVVDINSITGG